MMPCYTMRDQGMSCKLLYLLPDNMTKHGKPTLAVFVILFDAKSGKVKALMVRTQTLIIRHFFDWLFFTQQGHGVTERRTAAASALSARWLLSPGHANPRVLSVLGAGVQALSHIQVLTHLYPSIQEVHVWNRTGSQI